MLQISSIFIDFFQRYSQLFNYFMQKKLKLKMTNAQAINTFSSQINSVYSLLKDQKKYWIRFFNLIFMFYLKIRTFVHLNIVKNTLFFVILSILKIFGYR